MAGFYQIYQSHIRAILIQILFKFFYIFTITKAISPILPLEKISSPPSSIKRTPGHQKSISPIKVKLWYRAKPGYGLKAASKQRVPRRRAELLHHLSANADPRSEIRLFYSFCLFFLNFMYLNSKILVNKNFYILISCFLFLLQFNFCTLNYCLASRC